MKALILILGLPLLVLAQDEMDTEYSTDYGASASAGYYNSVFVSSNVGIGYRRYLDVPFSFGFRLNSSLVVSDNTDFNAEGSMLPFFAYAFKVWKLKLEPELAGIYEKVREGKGEEKNSYYLRTTGYAAYTHALTDHLALTCRAPVVWLNIRFGNGDTELIYMPYLFFDLEALF